MARRHEAPQDGNQPRGRRARREANDSLLATSGSPDSLAPADLANLFSYTSPSFWGSWQAFAALPEATRAGAGEEKRSRRRREAAADRGGGGSGAALRRAEQALLRVEPGVRELLSQGFNEGLVRRLESDVRGLAVSGELCVELKSARDRAVAHGVSRYYGMKSRSFDTPPPECRRVTVIRADEGNAERPRPQVQLADLVLPRSQATIA